MSIQEATPNIPEQGQDPTTFQDFLDQGNLSFGSLEAGAIDKAREAFMKALSLADDDEGMRGAAQLGLSRVAVMSGRFMEAKYIALQAKENIDHAGLIGLHASVVEYLSFIDEGLRDLKIDPDTITIDTSEI